MSRFVALIDFAFGVLIIAGTPIVAFFGPALLVSWISASSINGLGIWGLLISFGSFLAVCVWRKRHRRARRSLFPLEVGLGVFCGLLFMVALLIAGFTAG